MTLESIPAEAVEFSIISMASSVIRREKISRMMEKSPWTWRFVEARTAVETLPYDPERAALRRGYRLTRAELGCFESHLHCLREHAESGPESPEFRIILEDDVQVDPDFAFDRLPGLLKSLDLHYLKLYTRYMPRSRYLGRIDHRSIYRFVVPPYGSQAYIVSKTGARRFLQTTFAINRPIDDEIDRYWVHKLPTYALYPYPVLELQLASTVPKGDVVTQGLPILRKAQGFSFRWLEKFPRELESLRLRRQDAGISKRLAYLRGG